MYPASSRCSMDWRLAEVDFPYKWPRRIHLVAWVPMVLLKAENLLTMLPADHFYGT